MSQPSDEPTAEPRRYCRPYEIMGNVTSLPNRFLAYPGVSPTAKLVYATLARFSNGQTYCYPRLTTIGEALGVTRRGTLIDAIRELEEHEFIDSERRGQGLSNVYRFLQHPLFSEWMNQAADPYEPEPRDDPGDPPAEVTVKRPDSTTGPEVRTSRSPKSEHQEVRKADIRKSEKRTSRSADFGHPVIDLEVSLLKKTSSSVDSKLEPNESLMYARAEEEEEEELTVITTALTPWSGGRRTARAILKATRQVDPNVPAAAIAAMIPASTPEKTSIDGPGFFIAHLPEVMSSDTYAILRDCWTEKPWPETERMLREWSNSRRAPRLLRETAVLILGQYRVFFDRDHDPARAEMQMDRRDYEDQRDIWHQMANDPTSPHRDAARRLIARYEPDASQEAPPQPEDRHV